jgi:hypothetical protein
MVLRRRWKRREEPLGFYLHVGSRVWGSCHSPPTRNSGEVAGWGRGGGFPFFFLAKYRHDANCFRVREMDRERERWTERVRDTGTVGVPKSFIGTVRVRKSLPLPLCLRECVLFIGTRFSNLYTAVDTPAEAA